MSGEVGHRTAWAAVWAFTQTAGTKVITLAGLTILARILAPQDFGLLAFAMVYMTYAETIGDFGTTTALVYWPDRRDDAAQVTFIMNVATGILWCLLTIVLAPYIAAFFKSPNGTNIVRVLSIAFVIRYIGNTHDALAQKDLRFRARMLPELGLTAVKAVLSIALALAGFGVWSLVWGQLAGITCLTILRWMIVPWRPTWRVPTDLFGPMLAYGRGIVLVDVVSAVMYNLDLAVVGRAFSATVLGLYQMASKIPEATIVVILWVVSSVLFPVFSRLHAAGEDVGEPYVLAMRYVAALTLPAAIGLYFVAGPLVFVCFGRQWVAAAPILRALAIYVGVRSLDHHSGDVLKAIGCADLLAVLNFVKAALIVVGVFVGARISAVGVAGSLAVVYAIGTVVTLVAVSRVVRIPLASIALAFTPALKAGTVMTIALVLWTRWSASLSPLPSLLGGMVVGAITYVVALCVTERNLVARALQSLYGGRGSADALLRAN